MTSSYDIRTLVRAWRFLVLTSLLGAGLALLFSAFLPWQYSSTTRLLVTQNNIAGVDPYTEVKSTERIADNLAELVYTSTFTQEILSQAKGFDQGYLPTDEYHRRQAWGKMIVTSVVPNTGILSVVAYHPDPNQAHLLVDAAARVLADEASNYFGYNVRVQQIDTPLDSPWFAKPRFVANAVFGFFIGLLGGMAWVLLRLGLQARRGK